MADDAKKAFRLPDGRFLPGTAPGPGRDPEYETPEDLWTKCLEYFEWVQNTPLKSSQVISFQGVGTLVEVPRMRAMTIDGMALHLGISSKCWREYSQKVGFGSVTTRAEQVLTSQKFEGAAADLLNANIIARDLGLRDKTEATLQNPDGSAVMDPLAVLLAKIDGKTRSL